LSYAFSATSSGAQSCVWDFGDGTSEVGCSPVAHTYFESGCYSPTFTVLNEFGCAADTLLFNHICVHPVPLAAFTYGPTDLTIYQSTTQFVNLSAGATNYLWNFNINGEIQSSTQTNLSYSFPLGAVGFYPVTLYAISDEGCIDSTTIVIEIEADVILYVPNTFTPDGDQFNEIWRVYADGIDIYTFHLQVFNRWGELIWESYNAEAGWNGKYGGKVVPDGTYIWKISAKHLFKDKRQTWTGHVNVLR
jgi:gliding motility-associated-like protein